MKLHELKPAKGSVKTRKRVGRGDASGLGKTCGRGNKGQKSRSGAVVRPLFEGGQIPLFRRIPKRGFTSYNPKLYNVINLSVIEAITVAGDVLDIAALKDKGFIRDSKLPLKILANGELTKAITVKADKFSQAAKAKIEAAGGKCEAIG
ncbi:MAG: 50S ribosomal protein L15 [Victivallales bacterium]|nr:50S ribosomal protein L15 [Victivallales bacterium]